MSETEAKPASASYVEMTEIVQPGDTNSHGTMFGGRVVSLMDIAAAAARSRSLPISSLSSKGAATISTLSSMRWAALRVSPSAARISTKILAMPTV